jgi:hypothetical protein
MTPLSSGDCETSKRISWNNLVRLISALVLVLAPAVSEQPAWADEALTARNKAVVRDFYTTVLIGRDGLGQTTPSASPSPTPSPQPSPTGNQWEYQTISADNTTDLLNQANTQGTQGWELAGVVLDTSRPDKYVGFLKRKKQ